MHSDQEFTNSDLKRIATAERHFLLVFYVYALVRIPAGFLTTVTGRSPNDLVTWAFTILLALLTLALGRLLLEARWSWGVLIAVGLAGLEFLSPWALTGALGMALVVDRLNTAIFRPRQIPLSWLGPKVSP